MTFTAARVGWGADNQRVKEYVMKALLKVWYDPSGNGSLRHSASVSMQDILATAEKMAKAKLEIIPIGWTEEIDVPDDSELGQQLLKEGTVFISTEQWAELRK